MRFVAKVFLLCCLAILGAGIVGGTAGCGGGLGVYECCGDVWYDCCGYIYECWVCKPDGTGKPAGLGDYYTAERLDGVTVHIPVTHWFDPENPSFFPVPIEPY